MAMAIHKLPRRMATAVQYFLNRDWFPCFLVSGRSVKRLIICIQKNKHLNIIIRYYHNNTKICMLKPIKSWYFIDIDDPFCVGCNVVPIYTTMIEFWSILVLRPIYSYQTRISQFFNQLGYFLVQNLLILVKF